MIYFTLLRIIYLISLKDRCREYHHLLLQDSSGIEELTQEQKQRIKVISYLSSSRTFFFFVYKKFLESKLDIFDLAYIRHKIETEGNRFSSMMERNGMVQEEQLKTNQIAVNTSIQNTNSDTHRNRWDSWSKMKNSFRHLTKSM